MSRPFDYNGFAVSKSEPKKSLRTVKKTLLIDSADRDTTKYFTNGDFVVYLPRVYENVVSIRLAAAEFPPLLPHSYGGTISGGVVSGMTQTSTGIVTVTVAGPTPNLAYAASLLDPRFVAGASVTIAGITGTNLVGYNGTFTVLSVSGLTFTIASTLAGTPPVYTSSTTTLQNVGPRIHRFADGEANVSSTRFINDSPVPAQTYYFLLELEGLNKTDELAVGSSKSSFPDGVFAKIVADSETRITGQIIAYSDHSAQENIARYSPAIGKIDRLHIRTRLHNQKDNNIGFMYWTTDGNYAGASTNTGANYALTLEIEMLDNVFDDFSSMETHLRDRS